MADLKKKSKFADKSDGSWPEKDRQSKDLGSNPSAVESIFVSTERFSKFFNIIFVI